MERGRGELVRLSKQFAPCALSPIVNTGRAKHIPRWLGVQPLCLCIAMVGGRSADGTSAFLLFRPEGDFQCRGAPYHRTAPQLENSTPNKKTSPPGLPGSGVFSLSLLRRGAERGRGEILRRAGGGAIPGQGASSPLFGCTFVSICSCPAVPMFRRVAVSMGFYHG